MALERDKLCWLEGDMPFSERFGDHFYARNDGRAECGHVFMGGNGLPDRWTDCQNFTIAELGFGTGLNLLETWRQWCDHRQPGQLLHFVSFEAFPMQQADIEKAIGRWPALASYCQLLCAAWGKLNVEGLTVELDQQMRFTLVVGDARETVPFWKDTADAWYLDGFAPARNQAMWEASLMQAVFDHTIPGGSFATYTAAGWVRRNLQTSGFDVYKRPGYGGKREMMIGQRPV